MLASTLSAGAAVAGAPDLGAAEVMGEAVSGAAIGLKLGVLERPCPPVSSAADVTDGAFAAGWLTDTLGEAIEGGLETGMATG